MGSCAKNDFMSFQKKARSEFCELHRISKKDNNISINLIDRQDVFLDWLKGPKVLKKLGYLGNTNSSQEEINECYENAIMFYCGEKLWKNSRNSFNEHKITIVLSLESLIICLLLTSMID